MCVIERPIHEIDEVLPRCGEVMENSLFGIVDKNYARGVKAALDWVTGQDDDNPMGD